MSETTAFWFWHFFASCWASVLSENFLLETVKSGKSRFTVKKSSGTKADISDSRCTSRDSVGDMTLPTFSFVPYSSEK